MHQQLPFSSLISTTYRKIEIQFVFKETFCLVDAKQPLVFDLIQIFKNYRAISIHVCFEVLCFFEVHTDIQIMRISLEEKDLADEEFFPE